jgi:hypothetical protein
MKKPAGNQRVFSIPPAAPRSLGTAIGSQMGANMSAKLQGNGQSRSSMLLASCRPN